MKKTAIIVGLLLALLVQAAPAQAWDLTMRDNYSYYYDFDLKRTYRYSGKAYRLYVGQVTHSGQTTWAKMVVALSEGSASLVMPDPGSDYLYINHLVTVNESTMRGPYTWNTNGCTNANGNYLLWATYTILSGSLPFTYDGTNNPMLEEEPEPYDQFSGPDDETEIGRGRITNN